MPSDIRGLGRRPPNLARRSRGYRDSWRVRQDACDAAETAANWVDHNGDALRDLSMDAAEVALGAIATDVGAGMIAAGATACGVSLPLVITGVGALVTAVRRAPPLLVVVVSWWLGWASSQWPMESRRV